MKGIASPDLPIYRDKLSEGGDEERREGEGELKSNRVRQVNAGNTIRQLVGHTEGRSPLPVPPQGESLCFEEEGELKNRCPVL